MYPTELLRDVATVYTPDATGAYVTVAKSGLACWLRAVSVRGAVSAPERAEMLALRRLTWVGYAMPDYAQVEIGGIRYNIVQGTVTAYRYSETGEVINYGCDLVRVD